MPYLILVRHGQSEWNALGLFTGQADIPLTELGIKQAKTAGTIIRDIELHAGHTSKLSRAQETLKHILGQNHVTLTNISRHAALNERSFGIYEGKSVEAIRHELGNETLDHIRRTWDHTAPEGESLKQVYDRILNYYNQYILPDLAAGKNVIVSAHAGVIRTFLKHLDQLEGNEAAKLAIGNGDVFVYEIDRSGKVLGKQIRPGKILP